MDRKEALDILVHAAKAWVEEISSCIIPSCPDDEEAGWVAQADEIDDAIGTLMDGGNGS